MASLGLISLTACGDSEPESRFPEAYAGVSRELERTGRIHFGEPVAIRPLGRTAAGWPCGLTDHGGTEYFIHASDQRVIVFRSNSRLMAHWEGLCSFDTLTPASAPRPVAAVPPDVPAEHGAVAIPDRTIRANGLLAVRESLRVPSSARFSDLNVRGTRLCGRVDAENAFGGRTGAQRFITAGTLVIFEDSVPEPEFSSVWNQVC